MSAPDSASIILLQPELSDLMTPHLKTFDGFGAMTCNNALTAFATRRNGARAIDQSADSAGAMGKCPIYVYINAHHVNGSANAVSVGCCA